MTRPFTILGSCKQELIEDQEKLLWHASETLIATQCTNKRWLYCIASDRDSCHCHALCNITLISNLHPTTLALSSLLFFNTRCGANEITSDFDWKHIFKWFQNTLLFLKGISINGIPLSISTIKFHLVACGMSASTADTLLSPNDKQDVILMIKLLNTISKLAPALDTDTPLTKSTCQALILLGWVYHHLLNAYMDVQLSLHEQLVHLSPAAHLILTMYHTNKGEFIPVQTFFDVMSMIKNVYFCIAKIQVDDLTRSLWIISLGSDGLEKVFRKVCSMVGNDTNTDQLQLTNRIDGAVQCVKIPEIHPEWGGQSWCLNIKPLPFDATDISNKYDHINLKS